MKYALNHLLFSDPVLKIFSVILGCALFLLVREDRIRELVVEVPVLLGEVGDSRIFTSQVPSSVRVRVRGRWSSMIRVLESRPAPYEVELRSTQDGESYVFEESQLRALVGVPGLSIVAVDPPSFDIQIEEKMSRVVPVEVITVGSVPDDYVVDPGAISFEPKTVRVTGPKTKVDLIDKITSYPIALDGLQRDLRADIWLKRPSEKFVTLGTDQITVEIAVHEREGEKIFKDVPVYVENCLDKRACKPIPATVDLKVRGSLSRIRWMEEQEDARWLVINAEEYSERPGRYRNAFILARPVEGVVLLPTPRKITLRVQSVLDEEEPEEVSGDEVLAAPKGQTPDTTKNPKGSEQEEKTK